MILLYGKRGLFRSLIIFAYLSFTTVRGQKIVFNSCECIKFLNIANIHVLDVWGKRIFICNDKIFFLCFFLFILFATQLFSTPVKSSDLATKLRYLRSSAFYRQPLRNGYFLRVSQCSRLISKIWWFYVENAVYFLSVNSIEKILSREMKLINSCLCPMLSTFYLAYVLRVVWWFMINCQSVKVFEWLVVAYGRQPPRLVNLHSFELVGSLVNTLPKRPPYATGWLVPGSK